MQMRSGRPQACLATSVGRFTGCPVFRAVNAYAVARGDFSAKALVGDCEESLTPQTQRLVTKPLRARRPSPEHFEEVDAYMEVQKIRNTNRVQRL